MATSKQTYECFICRKNGFDNVRVYLDGRDEQGKTIYRNPDMSLHEHKQQAQGQSKTIITKATNEERIMTLLSDLNIKMNRVIEMLENR